jgi:Immunity protein family (Imm11)
LALPPDSERRLDCSSAFVIGEREGLDRRSNTLCVRMRESERDPLALARAEELPADPLEFIQVEGVHAGDFVATTSTSLYLVSPQFRRVLREREFTGWTSFPVGISMNDGTNLDGYEGLAVTGRCGPIDDSLSEEIIIPPPVPEGRARRGLRGLCFQPDSWDGSDVFVAEGYGGCFVTEAVKDALEYAGMTNIDFERLSEIERIWRADSSLVPKT